MTSQKSRRFSANRLIEANSRFALAPGSERQPIIEPDASAFRLMGRDHDYTTETQQRENLFHKPHRPTA